MKILAVVIGNNDYLKPHNLTNAIADAQAMADVFVRLGYDIKTIYNMRYGEVPGIMEMLEKGFAQFRRLHPLLCRTWIPTRW